MPKVNPKTQAVIDAFMDIEAPEQIRSKRKAELQELRPKLYNALQDLVKALYDDKLPHIEINRQE